MQHAEYGSLLANAGPGACNLTENQFTEAFAFMLRASDAAARAFAAWAANGRFLHEQIDWIASIDTQLSVRGRHGRAIPDLHLRVRTRDGREFTVRSEHKLGARGDPNQVDTYRDLPDVPRDALVMVYLTAEPRNIPEFAPRCDRAARWCDVAALLEPLATTDEIVRAWVAVASGVGRGQVPDTGPRDALLLDVCREMVAGELCRAVPQRLRASARCDPRRWDIVAACFGLADGPFNVRNCDCVYTGFRVAPNDFRVPLLADGCVELVLGIHTRKGATLPPGAIEAAYKRLLALPTHAPARVLLPGDLGRRDASHFHKLVACAVAAECGLDLTNPVASGAACGKLLAAWMHAVFDGSEALVEAIAAPRGR